MSLVYEIKLTTIELGEVDIRRLWRVSDRRCRALQDEFDQVKDFFELTSVGVIHEARLANAPTYQTDGLAAVVQ